MALQKEKTYSLCTVYDFYFFYEALRRCHCYKVFFYRALYES